jgi:hypothetical protein
MMEAAGFSKHGIATTILLPVNLQWLEWTPKPLVNCSVTGHFKNAMLMSVDAQCSNG